MGRTVDRRIVMAPIVALLLALAVIAPTAAGRQWCRRDPVFLVAGTRVNVEAAIPVEEQVNVTGAITVVLYVPSGVSASLIAQDEGFNGYGEQVEILVSKRLKATAKSVQIQIKLTVPAARNDIPVQAFVTPAGGRPVTIQGRTNQEVLLTAAVKPSG